MTDYRRTEEEIWEEDVVDDDRPTNVLPLFAVAGRSADTAAAPRAEPPGASSSAAGGPDSEALAEGESAATQALEGAPSEARTDASVDEPSASGPGEAPVRVGEEEPAVAQLEEAQRRPLPPPAPLPSMMLGPTMSTRGDITERVSTIPRTHPFANSIAPGGSMLTVPPRRADHTRWYGLGAVALLAMGATAAVLLQSRGEHHGLTARFNDERPRVPELAADETFIVVEESPEPVLLSDGPEPVAILEDPGHRTIAEVQRPPLESAARRRIASQRNPSSPAVAEATETKPSHRVAVGSVQLREAAAAPDSPLPDRGAVMEAMDRLDGELRGCVGDEHGIADVTLTVRGNGTVTHALVEGAFAGSEKGTCIARTLRGAKLPAFAQPVLHIAYPLKL